MSFEVDRYPSAWAHIALCADLTWATEPPDEFIIANQVLLILFAITLDPQDLRTIYSCPRYQLLSTKLSRYKKYLLLKILRGSDSFDVYGLFSAPLGTTLPCFSSPTGRNNRISQLTN